MQCARSSKEAHDVGTSATHAAGGRPLRSAAPAASHAATESAAPGFVKRHPVLTYYAVVFATSWGGFLLLGGRGLVSTTNWQSDPLFQTAVLALLAGPPLGGLLLTGLVSGRAGMRELLARLLRWRVGARWYTVALLTAPPLMTATLLVLSLVSPQFLPAVITTDDETSPVLLGIAFGLFGAFVEEIDWTGFAMPPLRLRHSVVTTGVILGVLFPATISGVPFLTTFLVFTAMEWLVVAASASSRLGLPRFITGTGRAEHSPAHGRLG